MNNEIISKTVVGLTGGLASGKDTAAKFFAELGFNIIDADVISRRLTKDGMETTATIIKHFGQQVAQDNNGRKDYSLDRTALRKLVFNDADALRWLEQLLHPLIRGRIKRRIANSNHPYCLLVVPLLLEGDLHKLCNGGVVVVDAPIEQQIERACHRDDITPELAKSIIQRQLSREERLKRADYVLDNSGTPEQLGKQVIKLHMGFLEENKNPILRYRILIWELEDLQPSNDIYYKAAKILWQLSHKYNFVYDTASPDFIIVHSNLGRDYAYRTIIKLRKRHGFSPFIILCSQESTVNGKGIADYSFTYQAPSPDNFWIAQYAMPPHPHGEFNDLLKSKPPNYEGRIGELRNNPKDRFCNFIYARHRPRLKLTKIRQDFCIQLAKYKKIDCPGTLLNNTDELNTKFNDNKPDYISRYKFSIAFENKKQEYYITEKIMECFMAGSIPIYYGSPNVASFFNPKAFINCADYKSFDEVIELVKQIDNDDKLYQEYLTAPPILPDSPLYEISWDRVLGKWDSIFMHLVGSQREGTSRPDKSLLRWRVKNYKRELESVMKGFARKIIELTKFIIRR